MSLLQVKHYLQDKRLVTLLDLCKQFKLEPEILRQMLKILINKGSLREKKKTMQCGSQCAKCHPLQIEMYEWVEST